MSSVYSYHIVDIVRHFIVHGTTWCRLLPTPTPYVSVFSLATLETIFVGRRPVTEPGTHSRSDKTFCVSPFEHTLEF